MFYDILIGESYRSDFLKGESISYMPVGSILIESEKIRFLFIPFWREKSLTIGSFNHTSLLEDFALECMYLLLSVCSTPICVLENSVRDFFCFFDNFVFFIDIPTIEKIEIKYRSEYNEKYTRKKSEDESRCCGWLKPRK
ncbi:MAG: hypothetical protein ACD_78C00188G0002 [uncultured bacterium (gcode 4)]|uniref:Uncharacterized protein n=1 Tax=uncultured bacterium (gcode 4) TaxID=1234023 RepID=K1XXU2_9BACT|nr:MAG: hypothetical protein ACD_78C00188G0002 [uncultured bacterium (gcode 4)]